MNRRAYSINEFGLAYGPKRSLTYKLLNEGKLKAVKVGKKRLILTDDAEAWLSSLRSSTHQIAAPLDGDSRLQACQGIPDGKKTTLQTYPAHPIGKNRRHWIYERES